MFADEADAPALVAHERTWRGRDVVAGLALFALLLALVIGAIGAYAAWSSVEDEDVDAFALASTAMFELLLAGIVLLLAWRRGLDLRDIGFRRPTRWGPLPVAWIGSYVILAIYGLVLTVLDQLGVDVSGFDEGNAAPVADTEGLALLLLLGLSVVVLAPVCEELFFRALLFRGLRNVWGRGGAIAASGVLFGAFHLNISVILPFTLIGALFAWAYDQSGSLWTSIAAHFLVNSLALTVAFAFE